MDLEYGVQVEDKNRKVLGQIDHIIMDTWTGEQRKFVIRREAPQTDLFFKPDQISEGTKEKVKLNVSLEEMEHD